MNKHFEEASTLLCLASDYMRANIKDSPSIESLLFFAIGVERMFKGILYEVNPIYVLKNQKFGNTVPVIYSSQIVSTFKLKEVQKVPDFDVLSYRTALSRARLFSETINNYATQLFYLADTRDKIAHGGMDLINMEKIQRTIHELFYPLIYGIATENSIDVDSLLCRNLEDIKSAFEKAKLFNIAGQRVEAKIKAQTQFWDSIKNEPQMFESAKGKTKEALGTTLEEFLRKEIKCPVCENNAIVEIEPYQVIIDGNEVMYMEYAKNFNCYYCELVFDEVDEIDYLNIRKNLFNGILEFRI